MTLDLKRIRRDSLQAAAQLGLPVNRALPLLDDSDTPRSADELVQRLLVLNVMAACAHGFDRKKAQAWTEQEDLLDDMTPTEAAFLATGKGDRMLFMMQVEAMWALAWGLGMIEELDFTKACSDQFVLLFPDLRRSEDSSRFKSGINLRPLEQVLPQLDLAYCLHWGLRELALRGQRPPAGLEPYLVIERRRALEWAVYTEEGDWDEISLDT